MYQSRLIFIGNIMRNKIYVTVLYPNIVIALENIKGINMK